MEGDASVDRENCNFLPMEIFVLSIQRIKFIDKKKYNFTKLCW